MISRTYIVKMPTSSPTTALDILVRTAPGSKSAPVTAGSDGAYYEWFNRPLGFEQLKLLSTGAANPAWAPRARLGFHVSITPIGAAVETDIPGVQLSASFGSLASTDSGPTINIPALADSVSGGPIIRLIGAAGTAGNYFVVNLDIMEPSDMDHLP